MFSRCLKRSLLTLTVTTLTACVADNESPYARFAAFFRFTPVTAAPSSLLPALTSPGEWCYVSIQGTSYQFKSSTGKVDTYPKTALAQYGTTLWIGGLLVGTPTVPEIGATAPAPICYDIVCPNCFEEDGIQRSVTVSSASIGRATCSRCHRTYDLLNSGVVVEGATSARDSRLYRYLCHYVNNTFVVQN